MKTLRAVKPVTKSTPKIASSAKRVFDFDERNYWSAPEAEEIIRRVAAGEKIAEEAERLDVMIDPSTAMVWLRRNKQNRRISQRAVSRYAADMSAGHWPYTHQGIAFDRYGALLDGQHRLMAVIESGCTVPMQVTVNMAPEIKRAIDQGKPRTTADVATLEARTPIEAAMAAVANRMMAGVQRKGFNGTRTDAVDFILEHLPAVVFSVEQIPQREFVHKRGCRTMIDAQEIYCRAEYALLRFLDGQKVARLYAVERESFLLPKERTEGN